jgi:AmmeMemoRadiSam system protein A
MKLSEKAKGVLILAARDSIHSLFGDKLAPIIDFKFYPELAQVGAGAFVTLTLNKQLRGCIGYITSELTLFDTVCDAAKQAALNDPRFYPVTENEFAEINIEISILSPLSPIYSYDQIQLGVHGLVLDDEYNRAILLPQVAVENNFDLPQFLTALCEKAGLDPYAWETDMLNIKTFTAIIFSEIDNRKRTYEQG